MKPCLCFLLYYMQTCYVILETFLRGVRNHILDKSNVYVAQCKFNVEYIYLLLGPGSRLKTCVLHFSSCKTSQMSFPHGPHN